ncbi:MAG: PSD1 and planctomycete cytochrome C domain-containing protein, partial [Planctomycetes bacterium]|nr:PSD1 and planctomycete cytochrome C domain-containing protein [Planctomycetota bacterium]
MFQRITLSLVVLLSAIASDLAWGAEKPEKQPAEKATEAAKPDAKGIEFFEAKIRPILANHCYKCHSVQAGKAEGSLQVDSREAIRTGGDRGAAVVPGDPDASLLLTAIRHTDSDLQMPPKKDKLSEAIIKDFESWIRMGAPDPRERTAAGVAGGQLNIEAGRKFWAFQKPAAHENPTTQNTAWPKRDLDHFVLARLEAKGLAPSPDAKPAVFLRRLHFDLVGLPPSPTAVKRFADRIEAEGFDRALEIEVDSLLASPQFGERWGRHWLDVARFAESSGKDANMAFPYAWRYRDYVIDCVNADVPFDRFLVEQIAGDLLPYDNDQERARLLIATGFLAVGPKNLSEGNEKQFAADVIDEQIDSVTRAVMASSVACARCHDHKFDPFAMEDYYSLAGIFASTKTFFGTFITPINQVGGDPLVLPRVKGQKIFHKSIAPEKVASLKTQLAALHQERDEMKEYQTAALKAIIEGKEPPTPKKVFTLTDALRNVWTTGGVEGQLEAVDDEGKALPLTMGTLDREQVADAPLLERGDVAKPGKIVARGFPRVIDLENSSIPEDHSGRLEFAQWLTHPDHPLTARVMVNRIWHGMFGTGIVSTVDNFGTTGDPPSHPELLDQLAVRFMADGWSVKK